MKTKRIFTWLVLVFLSCISFAGCKEEEKEDASIQNIKWELVSIEMVSEDVSKTLETTQWGIYCITFNDDYTFSGEAYALDITGKYSIDFEKRTISIIEMFLPKIMQTPEQSLFIEKLSNIQFFSQKQNELKLYFNEADYLSFKNENI
jgi:hypothetical protein